MEEYSTCVLTTLESSSTASRVGGFTCADLATEEGRARFDAAFGVDDDDVDYLDGFEDVDPDDEEAWGEYLDHLDELSGYEKPSDPYATPECASVRARCPQLFFEFPAGP